MLLYLGDKEQRIARTDPDLLLHNLVARRKEVSPLQRFVKLFLPQVPFESFRLNELDLPESYQSASSLLNQLRLNVESIVSVTVKIGHQRVFPNQNNAFLRKHFHFLLSVTHRRENVVDPTRIKIKEN